MNINSQGYIQRTTRNKKPSKAKPTKRDWWLIKAHSKTQGYLEIGGIYLPKHLIGKKIKIKIEIIKLENEKR